MIGAIKRRWKSNKKCADKDKEKVTPLPSFPTTTTTSCSRKGTLPPVDFIHVNSGRIELHPGGDKEKDNIIWGQPHHQHLHYETRHSWCGPQQMGAPDNASARITGNKSSKHKADQEKDNEQLMKRLTELEKLSKETPQLEPIVSQLKEDFGHSMGRQERLAVDLENLHIRVHTLETHNKALANIILPTLVRLTKGTPRVQSRSASSSRLLATAVASSSTREPLSSVPALEEHPQPPSQLMTTLASTSETNIKLKPMRVGTSSASASSSPTKLPNKVPVFKKPDSLELKIESKRKLQPFITTVSSSSKSPVECRIPRASSLNASPIAKYSTTHPPSSSSNSSKSKLKSPTHNVSSSKDSKPKSKLPVRKSSSSGSHNLNQTPSSEYNPPSKPSKLAVVDNKNKKPPFSYLHGPRNTPTTAVGCDKARAGVGIVRPIVPVLSQIPGLPLKDEGYSTMSNGAIDAEPPKPTAICSATFTRPKKSSDKTPTVTTEGNYGTTTSSGKGVTAGGTWTKEKKGDKSKTIDAKAMQGGEGRTFATATLKQPASITTTKDNVRIVRGIPHEIRFSSESSSHSHEDDFSGGTILWEDSDDSDILFMPIEVSSTSGSESTLVPYPYSRSRYSTNTTTTTTSTMGSDSTSTYYTAQTTDSSTPTTPTPTPPTIIREDRPRTSKGGGKRKDMSNNNNNSSWGSTDEQDLVQRWMRLEDMRNEEATTYGDAQWSWDWDGIIQSIAKKDQAKNSSETLDIKLDARAFNQNRHHHQELENDVWALPRLKKSTTSGSEIDSSTWTKSKKKKPYMGTGTSEPQDKGNFLVVEDSTSADETLSFSEDMPAMTTEFKPAFYRLTSSTTEDKLVQTETCSSSHSSLNMEGENETELFLQCKNCLEKMSKLISLQQQESPPGDGEMNVVREDLRQVMDKNRTISEQVAELLRLSKKEGSASKWLPVPQGFGATTSNTSNTDYNLLSSSESEGLVSPSME